MVKVEVPRAVYLVITDQAGAVRGLVGSINPLMADLVLALSKADGSDAGLSEQVVRVNTDTQIMALGQDCFTVSRDFLLHSRALLFPALAWMEITHVDRKFPSGMNYTVVISY